MRCAGGGLKKKGREGVCTDTLDYHRVWVMGKDSWGFLYQSEDHGLNGRVRSILFEFFVLK
jgi:hypothetical protein